VPKFYDLRRTDANFKERKMPVLKALLTGQPRAYGDERATQPLKRHWETAIFKQTRAGEVHTGIHHNRNQKSCLAYIEYLAGTAINLVLKISISS
jgi:MOSC domain protein